MLEHTHVLVDREAFEKLLDGAQDALSILCMQANASGWGALPPMHRRAAETLSAALEALVVESDTQPMPAVEG